MPEHRLDLEELAAFVDGRLSGEGRARVLKLLAESEEAYEVFAETVRFQAEERAAEEEVAAARFPVWRRVAVPLAAAAALALLIATPLMRSLRAPEPPRLAAAELVALFAAQSDLTAALGRDWDQRTWSVTRGAAARLVEPELAFRLGVRTVDVKLALLLGDPQHAARLSAEMLELLGGVELSQAVAAQYAALRSRVAAGEAPDRLADGASRAEGALQELLGSPRFSFGQWCAAAELAARVRHPSLFRSPLTARFFDAADRLGLDAADVDAVRRIAELARDAIGDFEYAELQELLRAIIRRNGG